MEEGAEYQQYYKLPRNQKTVRKKLTTSLDQKHLALAMPHATKSSDTEKEQAINAPICCSGTGILKTDCGTGTCQD